MIRAWLCGCLLALAAALPLQAGGLYEALPAASLPAGLPASQGPEQPAAALLNAWSSEHWAVAVLEPEQAGRLSCLWYPGDAGALVTHTALPVQRGSRLWLSVRLDEPRGALRLARWPAAGGDLPAYALSLQPQGAVAPVADYWLDLAALVPSPAGGRLPLPWDPPQFWREDAPRGFEFAAWPLAQAWLDSSLSAQLKDCGLGGLAAATLVIDPGGVQGAWLLGASRELELYFCVPPGLAARRAAALLLAQPDDGFGLAEPRLSLALNRAAPEEAVLQPGLSSAEEWQQVRFDLSHKLQPGLNYLEAGAPLASAGACRVAMLQVWVQ